MSRHSLIFWTNTIGNFRRSPTDTAITVIMRICSTASPILKKHRDFIYSLFRCGLGNLLLTSLSDYITNTWYHPESGDTIEDFYVLQAFTGSLYSTYVSWAVRGKKETPQQLAQVLSELYAKKR